MAIVGFFPSYFSKLTKTDPVHHFHALMATAWMVMLIVQAWLYQQRKIALHRMIGRVSLILVPLFVVSAFLVIHAMLSSSNPFTDQFGHRLAFVDATSSIYFAVCYVLAIHYRKNLQLHARYIASTAILVLPAALERIFMNFIPGVDSFEAAFYWSFGIGSLIVVLLILNDMRKGTFRMPYLPLLFLLIVQTVSFRVTPSLSWWNDFCDWIGSI